MGYVNRSLMEMKLTQTDYSIDVLVLVQHYGL